MNIAVLQFLVFFGLTLINSANAEETVPLDPFSGQTVFDSRMAMAMIDFRARNAPRVEATAPELLFGTSEGKQVSINTLCKRQPVVLIFSSWGCDIFRESIGGLVELHNIYRSKAIFLMVYIREAHSLGGFDPKLSRVVDPANSAERKKVALRCKRQLRIPFPMIVDGTDDALATRWSAWPVRVFVIDTDGKIAFAGAQGPWGYRPYRGFVHGNGDRDEQDKLFSQESLEEFLERRFNTSPGPFTPEQK